MEKNYEKIPDERLKNMEVRQRHRKNQIESVSKNIYDKENQKLQKELLIYGAPGGIRTPDLKVRSLAFYPTKLRVQIKY